MSANRLIIACALAAALSGCGLFVPEKNPLVPDTVDPVSKASSQGEFEFTVVQHVMCEIRTGLWKAHYLPHSAWLKQLGAQVTLELVAGDQSALSPSASFLQTFGLKGAESFTFGIGGAGSANATRTETIQFTYPNKELWREALIDARAPENNNCESFQKGIFIESNLKIDQFIYDKAVVASGIYGYGNGLPFSQLQFEINFVHSFSGNIAPTWKFTTTNVNSGSLLSATRTDTDTVTITLGALTADTKALQNAAVTANKTGQAIQSNAP
jgi:hypothetical protein